MGIRNAALWLTGALVLSGCASTSLEGQPFFDGIEQPPSDRGYLYFLRPAGPIGSAVVPTIEVDKLPVGTLPAGSYFRTELPAGSYRVKSTTPPVISGSENKEFTLRVQNGATYFIVDQQSTSPYSDGRTLGRVNDGSYGGTRFYFRYALMEQASALRALEYCRLSPSLTRN